RERLDDRTPEAMEEGLVTRWEQLAELGVPVVALLDNPSPGMEVYECVAEHPERLEECDVDREQGIASSAATAQRAAAERVHTDWVCPQEQCVPVIGDVLLYRQGTHLTDTYVRSATPLLAAELVPLVEELTGSAPA